MKVGDVYYFPQSGQYDKITKIEKDMVYYKYIRISGQSGEHGFNLALYPTYAILLPDALKILIDFGD